MPLKVCFLGYIGVVFEAHLFLATCAPLHIIISMQADFAHSNCSSMDDDKLWEKLERTGGMCLWSMDYDVDVRGRENVCPHCPLQSSASLIVFSLHTEPLDNGITQLVDRQSIVQNPNCHQV